MSAEARPGSTPLLEVRDLEVTFSVAARRRHAPTQLRAVDGASFTLAHGETLGLVGESGSGKTTAGRAVLQLLRPTAGSVRFEGEELTTLWRKRFGRYVWSEPLRELRRRMQLIFQDPYASLDPRMTVEQIVAEPLTTFAVARGDALRRRVGELLERVGMDPRYAKRYPHEFSGGQRQRIGIARALALSPSLVVCDEPISALDVSIQAQILNLLAQLQRELGLSYLFIAHDLAAVRHIASRIAVMYLGRIVEVGGAESLCRSPLHPYSQALIASVPVPDPQIERARVHLPLAGEVPSPLSPPAGCTFHPRCPLAEPRCRERVPRLEPVPTADGSGRLVACHVVADALRSDPGAEPRG